MMNDKEIEKCLTNILEDEVMPLAAKRLIKYFNDSIGSNLKIRKADINRVLYKMYSDNKVEKTNTTPPKWSIKITSNIVQEQTRYRQNNEKEFVLIQEHWVNIKCISEIVQYSSNYDTLVSNANFLAKRLGFLEDIYVFQEEIPFINNYLFVIRAGSKNENFTRFIVKEK